MGLGKRQKFHPEIGRKLAKLREDRHLSQGQVEIAAKGKLPVGTLKAIETGRVKNPDPEHLRVMATIYGVPFFVVAEPFIAANYGRDLIRHGDGQQFAHDAIEAGVQLKRLEAENSALRSLLEEVQNVSGDLLEILSRGDEIRTSRSQEPTRRSRARKTG